MKALAKMGILRQRGRMRRQVGGNALKRGIPFLLVTSDDFHQQGLGNALIMSVSSDLTIMASSDVCSCVILGSAVSLPGPSCRLKMRVYAPCRFGTFTQASVQGVLPTCTRVDKNV